VSNWTSGYAQGSNTITLDSVPSGTTTNNTLLILDQCDNGYSGSPCAGTAVDNGNYFNCEADWTSPGVGCSYTGPVGAERTYRGQQEIVEATAIQGNTITITPALRHPNWNTGNTPQVWIINPSRYVGVRGLTIDGSNFPYNGGPTAGIGFAGTSYFWVTDVVISSLPNISLFITQEAAHGQIESNYIYNSGQSNPLTDSSGINFLGANHLITNNICQNAHLCVLGNGPVEGDVVSYNFIVNANTGDSVLYEGIRANHSNGADYNLFEGNATTAVFMDQAHGTTLVDTYYRNFLYGWEPCGNGNCGSNTQKTDNLFAFQVLSNHRYGNYIGNVLGTPGISNQSGSLYQFTDSMWYHGSGGVGNIWDIGSGNNNSPPSYAGPISIDPVVAQTIMRWGNWDAKNGTTQWNTSEVPTSPPAGVLANSVPSTSCTSSNSCPASFYLSSPPTWWASSIPFPAIGPDVSGGNVGQCGGTVNQPGQYALVAATNAGQCAGQGLNSAWGGHVNANPAMACYLNTMKGLPDGTGSILSFDANSCYSASSGGGPIPAAPTNLTGSLLQ
jgi:hypothetical protein